MKGLVLAAGSGRRLLPLTKNVNKHLLKINNKPMIFYVVDGAVNSGINQLIIVYNLLGKEIPTLVKKYIKKNYPFVNVSFVYEENEPKGVAHSILIGKEQLGNDVFTVMFSDVIFQQPLTKYINSFDPNKFSAKFLLAYAEQPESHASVYFKENKIDHIVEKSDDPDNNVIITTYDIFTPKVWKYSHLIRPSPRGELEITDLRNLMIKNERTDYDFVKGWWIDAGTHERLKTASELIKNDLR